MRKKTAAKTIPSHPRTHRPGTGLQPGSADINCFLPKTALWGAAPPCRSHPGPASFSAPLRLLSSLAGSPENPLQGAHTPQRGAAAAPLAPGFSVPRPHLLRVRCGGSAPVLCSLLRGHRRSSLPWGLELLRVPLSPQVTLESHSTTAGTGQVMGSRHAGRVQTRSQQHPKHPSPAQPGLHRATSAAKPLLGTSPGPQPCPPTWLSLPASWALPQPEVPTWLCSPPGCFPTPTAPPRTTPGTSAPSPCCSHPQTRCPLGVLGQLLNPPPRAAASVTPLPKLPSTAMQHSLPGPRCPQPPPPPCQTPRGGPTSPSCPPETSAWCRGPAGSAPAAGSHHGSGGRGGSRATHRTATAHVPWVPHGQGGTGDVPQGSMSSPGSGSPPSPVLVASGSAGARGRCGGCWQPRRSAGW